MILTEFKENFLNAIILMIILAFLGLDIKQDLSDGVPYRHMLHEISIVLLCFLGRIILLFKFKRQKKLINHMNLTLNQVKTDLDMFKRKTKELSNGLTDKIDQQLETWGLTNAEKEVALLIIKGLSNKEIADVRNTSEKTVRQQATSIYHKSKISGRSELISYFLEDILTLPPS